MELEPLLNNHHSLATTDKHIILEIIQVIASVMSTILVQMFYWCLLLETMKLYVCMLIGFTIFSIALFCLMFTKYPFTNSQSLLFIGIGFCGLSSGTISLKQYDELSAIFFFVLGLLLIILTIIATIIKIVNKNKKIKKIQFIKAESMPYSDITESSVHWSQ